MRDKSIPLLFRSVGNRAFISADISVRDNKMLFLQYNISGLL